LQIEGKEVINKQNFNNSLNCQDKELQNFMNNSAIKEDHSEVESDYLDKTLHILKDLMQAVNLPPEKT
jgi:hypothetical protein